MLMARRRPVVLLPGEEERVVVAARRLEIRAAQRMAGANEGRGVEAPVRLRQQPGRIAPGGEVLLARRMTRMRQAIAARSGSASNARAARARVSARRIRRHCRGRRPPAVAERGCAVAPAGDAPVAVEPHEGGVRRARHRLGKQGQVLRPAPWSAIQTCLVMPGCARAEAIAATVSSARSRQDDDVGAIRRRCRAGGAGQVPGAG